MNRFQILLCVLILFISTVNAEEFSGNWGTDNNLEKSTNIIPLYKLTGWQITGNTAPLQKPGELPYFSDTADTLIFFTEFEIPEINESNKLYFTSYGFKGNVSVYINNNLIVKYPNGSNPFKIEIASALPLSVKNTIKIVLTKSSNYSVSFPIMTHLLTEPEYVGITRPFFLEWDHDPTIKNFEYKISRNENEYILSCNYDVSKPFFANITKLELYTFEEILSDKNGTVLSKRNIKLDRTNIHIKSEININKEYFWTPENPQNINVSVNAKRLGQVQNTVSYSVGVREITASSSSIFLNFEKIPIKGINYYENLKNYVRYEQVKYKEENLSDIKNDGFNAVRFLSHIPDERYLNIADSLGLLLFMDLPVKRLPDEAFQSDKLLENIKNTLASIIKIYKKHPSFAGIGLGQEIALNEPGTQKFFIILNGTVSRPIPFLTYLSPVNQKTQSKEMAADFYMADIYKSFSEKYESLKTTSIPYILAGKIGVYSYADYLNSNSDNYILNRKLLLLNDLNTVTNKLLYQGGFIECFMDWYSISGYHQTIFHENPKLINSGLYDLDSEKHPWARDLGNKIWENPLLGSLSDSMDTRATNIFSIIMFFGSLFFMFFYRRYPRLSENYRRALKHPYGFYVDMRERRIIPIFNSFIVGVHSSLILATFIGSFVYYWNNSILAQEFLRVICTDNAIFELIVRFSQSEFKILGILFLLVFLHPLLMGIILKIYGILTKNRVRLRQALAIGLWSGAPFIFMLPLSIGAYHLISKHIFIDILLYIFAIFMIWVNFRLANGIRVLAFARFSTIFILLLLSYILPVLIFLFVFTPQPMWTDYLITLLHSHSLF